MGIGRARHTEPVSKELVAAELLSVMRRELAQLQRDINAGRCVGPVAISKRLTAIRNLVDDGEPEETT